MCFSSLLLLISFPEQQGEHPWVGVHWHTLVHIHVCMSSKHELIPIPLCWLILTVHIGVDIMELRDAWGINKSYPQCVSDTISKDKIGLQELWLMTNHWWLEIWKKLCGGYGLAGGSRPLGGSVLRGCILSWPFLSLLYLTSCLLWCECFIPHSPLW